MFSHHIRCQTSSRILKKSASFVLALLRDSTYRSVRLASSLAAALLDSLFEHPTACSSSTREGSKGWHHSILPRLVTWTRKGYSAFVSGQLEQDAQSSRLDEKLWMIHEQRQAAGLFFIRRSVICSPHAMKADIGTQTSRSDRFFAGSYINRREGNGDRGSGNCPATLCVHKRCA